MSVGFASCVGGENPDPPIHDYPLLVWVGGEVRTEDGRASVAEVVRATAGGASIEAVASRFGTTPDHVRQAVDYESFAAGLL